MTDVSIVVVTYQAPEWTGRCLAALQAVVRDSRLDVEVVVVDNASDQPTRDVVAASGFRALWMAENIGFGRACNRGVAASGGRLVMLVNPDALAGVDAVEALAAFFDEDPGRGIVGGRTLTPQGALDPRSCWGAMTLWSLACFAVGASTALRGNRLLDPESLGGWRRDSVREVDVVTGCLLLTSREVWDRLGGFDEDFFMYGEDADLSRRARLAGLRPSITPAAEVVHAVGASSGTTVAKQRLLLRGRATLVHKQWTGWRRALGSRLLLAGVALRAVAARGPWTEVWRERGTWQDGWPADTGPAVTEGSGVAGPAAPRGGSGV